MSVVGSVFACKERSSFETLSYEHLFAVFFQARRAYYYIQRFIIGNSEAIQSLRMQAWNSVFTHNMLHYQQFLYSRMNSIVTLVLGPSGSGKELVARAIGLSQFIPFDGKKKAFAENFVQNFHPINLSAFSETLMESELFGHRKGSFTGALQDREGYLSTCGRYGSIFFDEIGETSMSTQVKLLRIFQSRQYQRLGDTELRECHGKFIAATNRNLLQEIETGRFREDLYYRLSADQISTPRLVDCIREDTEEVYFLVEHVLKKILNREGEEAAIENLVQSVYEKLPKTTNGAETSASLNKPADKFSCKVNTEHSLWNLPSLPPLPNDMQFSEIASYYCQRAYEEEGSLIKAATRLGIDRRTLKKYVSSRSE